MRIANDVAYAPVVHALRPILRIPDDLIDEVAKMQHEAQAIRFRRALILEDHPAVGVLSAVVGVLTTDERESHRARIVLCRRGDRSADTAGEAGLIGEPIPVNGGRL